MSVGFKLYCLVKHISWKRKSKPWQSLWHGELQRAAQARTIILIIAMRIDKIDDNQ